MTSVITGIDKSTTALDLNNSGTIPASALSAVVLRVVQGGLVGLETMSLKC